MSGRKNTVTLTVNNRRYGGWMSVQISAGIDQMARSFTLAVSYPWSDSNGALPVRPGDACTVSIGDDVVMTGYVDATPVSFDAGSVTRTVNGRSKTADLVDCSAVYKGGQWKNRKIENIAVDLAAYYGIRVNVETDTGLPVSLHQIQQGESVYQSLDRLLRARQLYLTDNEKGELVFIEVGKERAHTALVVGGDNGNVLSGGLTQDHTGRYSLYVCKGQSTGDDNLFGRSATQTRETGEDTGVRRHRVLIIKQSGQGDRATCRNRALYERDSRAGKSLSGSYTVGGWRQGDGSLWRPNLLVKVIDPISGFDDWLVIASVTYKLDSGGMTTTIDVAPKQAFSKQVDGNKDKTSTSKSKGGSAQWGELSEGVK